MKTILLVNKCFCGHKETNVIPGTAEVSPGEQNVEVWLPRGPSFPGQTGFPAEQA